MPENQSKKYIKRPYKIEAFQYNIDPRPDWFQDKVSSNEIKTYDDFCFIQTLEGKMEVQKGDYIIKGVEGELYPCKKSIFEKTYRLVDDIDLKEPVFADNADEFELRLQKSCQVDSDHNFEPCKACLNCGHVMFEESNAN
jgi:hypothetical protein